MVSVSDALSVSPVGDTVGVSRYSNDNFPSHGRGGIDACQLKMVAVVRFGSIAVCGEGLQSTQAV